MTLTNMHMLRFRMCKFNAFMVCARIKMPDLRMSLNSVEPNLGFYTSRHPAVGEIWHTMLIIYRASVENVFDSQGKYIRCVHGPMDTTKIYGNPGCAFLMCATARCVIWNDAHNIVENILAVALMVSIVHKLYVAIPVFVSLLF